MALQVWLPLTGNLKNLGLDDITVTNNGATINTAGKIGSCYDGTTSGQTIIVTVPDLATMLSNGKKYTFTCWAKMNSAAANTNQWIVKLGTNTCGFWWGYSSPRFVWNENNNGTRVADGETTAWHHFAVVVDKTVSGRITIWNYMDGLPSPGRESHSWDSSSQAQPAGDTITIYPYMAFLNDLRIYDDCLSPKEVKELSKGLVAHYPLNDGVGGENLCTSDVSTWYVWNSNTVLSYTDDSIKATIGSSLNSGIIIPFGNNNALVGGEECTISFEYRTSATSLGKPYIINVSGGNTPYPTAIPIDRSETQWKRFEITLTFPSTEGKTTEGILLPYVKNIWIEIKKNTFKVEKGSKATPWIPNPNDTLYSAMGLDNGIVYDCSGYGHDGAISSNNPIVNSDSIRYTTCLQFNGSNNYIDCGIDTWLPTDQITVSLWGYMTTWGSSRLLSCTEGGGWNFEAGDGGGWRFPVYKKGLGYCFSTPTKKWADYTSGWHHIVGTFDGYVSKIYIDGELDSVSTNQSPTVKKEIGYNQSAKFFIGCEAATANPSSPYFSGKISDVRIYATALSAEDIKSLYETRASIDSYSNTYAYEFMEV